MFKVISSFLVGVYCGQEYKGLPSIKAIQKDVLHNLEKELEKYKEK
jgi:hypothetical protein